MIPIDYKKEKEREYAAWMPVFLDKSTVLRECMGLKGVDVTPQDFDLSDEEADKKEGADVKVVRSGRKISLRSREMDGNPKSEWLREITVTSRLNFKDGMNWRTEIDKLRDGLLDLGLYGWHKPGEPIHMWVMYDFNKLRDALLKVWDKLPEFHNLKGRGRDKCWFKPVNINLLLNACAVVAFSEGHPAAQRTRIPVDPLDAALGVTESWIEAPEVKIGLDNRGGA